jgi:hypothetical protein
MYFMPQRTIPVFGHNASTDSTGTKQNGFTSTAAMIRHAVDQELTCGNGVEQHIAATLDQIQGATMDAFDAGVRQALVELRSVTWSSITNAPSRFCHDTRSTRPSAA